jgi:hypothetical protein
MPPVKAMRAPTGMRSSVSARRRAAQGNDCREKGFEHPGVKRQRDPDAGRKLADITSAPAKWLDVLVAVTVKAARGAWPDGQAGSGSCKLRGTVRRRPRGGAACQKSGVGM